MKKNKIVIEFQQYRDFEQINKQYKKLIKASKGVVHSAYAPYSKFNVGAAVLLENNEIITGTNQENSAYPSGLCAERVALFYANSKFPAVPVKALSIAAFFNNEFLENPTPPCGSCRQVILETEKRFNKPVNIILYGSEKIFLFKTIKDLLPLSFSSENFSD